MRKLQRSVVGVLVALATVMSAPAAVAAPLPDEEPRVQCDTREWFLRADGQTDTYYFETQLWLDGDYRLIQQIGDKREHEEVLNFPAGLYEWQNIVDDRAIIDPSDPYPRPVGYSLRIQI